MSNYRKIGTIISHEFKTKVKNKWFLIATLLGPLIMIALFAVPALISYFSMQTTTQKIAVIDLTNKYGAELIKTSNKQIFYISNASVQALSDSVRKDLVPSFLVIDSNMINSASVYLYSKGSGGLSINDKISDAVGEIRLNELLASTGVDKAVYDNLHKRINIQELKVSDDKAKGLEANSSGFQIILAYIAAFAIYMMILMYGQNVMRGVIEEKANRIVEIIASSARPFEIMFGKVVGIGLVGIVQMSVWIGLSLLILSLAAPILQSLGIDAVSSSQMSGMTPQMMDQAAMSKLTIPSISPLIFFALFFFFLAGYFIYATLYAGIGAAVDQEADAGQISTPVTLLIVIPIMMISAIMSDPNSTTSVVLSLIPFFSPMLMLARIIITNGMLPMWQVLLSVILCILTFLGSLWVAAKIYRIGILVYGKKPTIAEIFRWLTHSN